MGWECDRSLTPTLPSKSRKKDYSGLQPREVQSNDFFHSGFVGAGLADNFWLTGKNYGKTRPYNLLVPHPLASRCKFSSFFSSK